MSSGWIVDYNPSVCDGHPCPVDCDHCPYQDKARAANEREKAAVTNELITTAEK